MASIRMSAKDIDNFELEISTEDMLPRECSKCGRYTKGVKLLMWEELIMQTDYMLEFALAVIRCI